MRSMRVITRPKPTITAVILAKIYYTRAHYTDHEPESSSYGHSESYTDGDGEHGSYESHSSYSKSSGDEYGNDGSHYY